MDKEIASAILGGTGAMLGWGLADFFAKKAVDKIGNIRAVFWCQIIGILIILFFCKFNFSISYTPLTKILLLSISGIINAFALIYLYAAFEKGQLSIVSPISASYPAFSVLISIIFLKEKIINIRLLYLLVIFLGIILISVDLKKINGYLNKKINFVAGFREALTAMCLFAIWFPLWDSLVAQGDWIFLLIFNRIIVSFVNYIYCILKEKKLSIKNIKIWRTLFLIGLFDVSAYSILSWGYSHTSFGSIVTMLSSAYSLPVLVLARIFLGETLSRTQLAGAFIILFGVIALAST